MIDLSFFLTLLRRGQLAFYPLSLSFFLSIPISTVITSYIETNHLEDIALWISFLYFLILLLYLVLRKVPQQAAKIIKSKRVDAVILFVAGILSSIFLNGVGSQIYREFISLLTVEQILVLLSVPLVIVLSFLVRTLHLGLQTRKRGNLPFFVSDDEKKNKKDDLLDLYDIAEKFAERVLNQGSSESLVFGVDAPWGVGKSTFINFCREYWLREHETDVSIYLFNPLKYENRESLLEKFIDGLIGAVQKDSYIPEVKPLASRYASLIRSVRGSLFGLFDFELGNKNYSVDDAFEELEIILSSVDRKVIIVIDDLDRLNLQAIKDLLFTIKKSFTLPNVTYILCYDAENISALELHRPGLEKITEFLEKFVNVKIGLYLSSEKLSAYARANLKKALSGNSQADPLMVSKAMSGLKYIYDSNDYHRYVPFIGDIRKLKRLINLILLLDLEKTDFDNSDFNNQDLIHLLLIYINYPNIFRKIYNSETGGKKGFFSLVSKYEDGYPKDGVGSNPRFSETAYRNSTKYTEYINSDVVSDDQKFLLNKIFNIGERLDQVGRSDISEEETATLACFNGDLWSTGGRNLESYLLLIVRASKPQSLSQYKFYLNQKNKLIGGTQIEEILSDAAFSYSRGENTHKQLWRLIVNSAYEFNSSLGVNLIRFLVKNIVNYSHFEDENIELGLRHDMGFDLVRLLDQAGWVDEKGEHRRNFDENVSEIAEWVFGEGRHNGEGILASLSADDRGILGLYDLLLFRLYCSADRGGGVYNLVNALAKHSDPQAPTDGPTRNIAIAEMRKVSQSVFQIFNTQYIKTKINIFDKINDLTIDNVIGKFSPFLQEKIRLGETKTEDVERTLNSLKSKLTTFIVYQLGASSTSWGIACGYYNPQGVEDDKNGEGIRAAINDYLFDICFNPGEKKDIHKNYEHFLNYLLMNFVNFFNIDEEKLVRSLEGSFKVLSEEKVKKYWKKQRKKIKSLALEGKDKSIIVGDHVANYNADLLEVYKLLDDLTDGGSDGNKTLTQ